MTKIYFWKEFNELPEEGEVVVIKFIDGALAELPFRRKDINLKRCLSWMKSIDLEEDVLESFEILKSFRQIKNKLSIINHVLVSRIDKKNNSETGVNG